MKPDWNGLTTEQKDEIIQPLWLAGKSASEIAARFENCSRNAVIGRVHRGKMVQRKPPTPKRAKPRKPATAPKPKVIRNRNTLVTEAKPEPEADVHASRWIDNERPPIAGTTPISILDLPNRDVGVCRFPVIGGYCGLACGETVYCETHYRYAHVHRERPDVSARNRAVAGNLRRSSHHDE